MNTYNNNHKETIKKLAKISGIRATCQVIYIYLGQ